MDRLACLELPAFPLQVALRKHPDWRGEPAAVVERDAPHGLVLWANERARASGVLPGQRYAAALGTCGQLRATEVQRDEIERAIVLVVEELHHHSPEVEPHEDEPGVFWISGRGMERLFGAPRAWAERVFERVQALGFEAKLVVGFRRFPSYACARGLVRCELIVHETAQAEARTAADTPLARLAIEPKVRDTLAKLAVTTLRQFTALPAGGIRARFGERAELLHREASGALEEALAPVPEPIPVAAHVDLDFPLEALDLVLAHVDELLRPLVAKLERGGEAVAAIDLRLDLDDRSHVEESLRPAWASCDADWLMRLVRMRMEGAVLRRGATRIEVVVTPLARRTEQATLFLTAKARSPRAIARAFAALRASLGDDAVQRARLVSAHLPERSFAWERCDEVPPAKSAAVLTPPLVRCLYAKPLLLPPRPRHEPDGWLLRGVTFGSVVRIVGPYRLSGGWWGSEVRREYYFAELTTGQIAWIYHDVPRRRWLLQGTVS